MTPEPEICRIAARIGSGQRVPRASRSPSKGYPFLGLTTGWMLLSLIMVLVFPFVLAPLVYIPTSRTFDAAMADARAKGVMTAELRAAFANPALNYVRWYEAIAIVVVVTLMVLKPF